MAGRASLAGPSVSACAHVLTQSLCVRTYVYTQLCVRIVCTLRIPILCSLCTYCLCMKYSSEDCFQRITV